MHSALDSRKVRCLDGLHYSFLMLRHHYEGLWETCCAIPGRHSSLISALASAWGFIDAVYRIREIAQSVPGLSTRQAEMQVFLAATALAEDCIHYLHHLRGELANDYPGNASPVWGTLSWVDPDNPLESHMAVLGTQVEGPHYTGCSFDTGEKKWGSKVCLGLNGKSFNFDPVFISAVEFESFVLPFLGAKPTGRLESDEALPLVSLDFIRSVGT
jgi:hypothetical protein